MPRRGDTQNGGEPRSSAEGRGWEEIGFGAGGKHRVLWEKGEPAGGGVAVASIRNREDYITWGHYTEEKNQL